MACDTPAPAGPAAPEPATGHADHAATTDHADHAVEHAPAEPGAVPSRPAVADPADWCGGHGVPESMCTVCNPGLVARFRAAGDWCAEHGYPESVCPLCNPMDPPAGASLHHGVPAGARVRLESVAVERAAGIDTAPVTVVAMGDAIEVTARIEFDGNAMADVRTSAPGIVRSVDVDLGQRVAAGDPLFTLESAHVGDLRARRGSTSQRVESARANLARQDELREAAIASQRDVELARQELEVAEADLRSLDESLRISGAGRGGQAGRFVVRAPLDGEVTRRPVVVGTYASESDSLATIVDTSTMWAVLAVPERDAAVVRLGQPVELDVDGLAGRSIVGTLTWVAPEVDPRTRTVAARVQVENPEGLLRAGQFAWGRIRLEAPTDAVAVPADALQRVGDQSVVFVRVDDAVYEPRVVQPGRTDGRVVQVAGDVEAGDRVATVGAYLLRTELAPDAIGAGCCEVEPLAGD